MGSAPSAPWSDPRRAGETGKSFLWHSDGSVVMGMYEAWRDGEDRPRRPARCSAVFPMFGCVLAAFGGPCAPAAVFMQLMILTCTIARAAHCATQTLVVLRGECVAHAPQPLDAAPLCRVERCGHARARIEYQQPSIERGWRWRRRTAAAGVETGCDGCGGRTAPTTDRSSRLSHRCREGSRR